MPGAISILLLAFTRASNSRLIEGSSAPSDKGKPGSSLQRRGGAIAAGQPRHRGVARAIVAGALGLLRELAGGRPQDLEEASGGAAGVSRDRTSEMRWVT
jgi:hypothetical protein